MISEAVFQAALERAINAPERATRVQRINAGDTVVITPLGHRRRVRGAKKGTADFIGYAAPAPAVYLEVEAKAKKHTRGLAQRQRAAALLRAGAVHVFVTAGDDLDESVHRALAQIDLAIQFARSR